MLGLTLGLALGLALGLKLGDADPAAFPTHVAPFQAHSDPPPLINVHEPCVKCEHAVHSLLRIDGHPPPPQWHAKPNRHWSIPVQSAPAGRSSVALDVLSAGEADGLKLGLTLGLALGLDDGDALGGDWLLQVIWLSLVT